MHQPGTYQTRISGYGCRNRESGDAALAAYAELYSRVQRKLFADVAAGRPAVSLKSAYLERYGIPARMFNGIRVSLDGKVHPSGSSRSSAVMISGVAYPGRSVRYPMLLRMAAGSRSIRSVVGWAI